MASVNPYINFAGNCEEAFNFYKSVFGTEFAYLGRFSDMPPQEGAAMSEEEGKGIMHVSLPIGNGTHLFGSDAGGEWASHIKQGNNINICVSADNEDEARRLFDGLSAGGQVTMPFAKQFWGAWFGMFVDRFGINWMVDCSANQQKPEQA